MSLVEVKVPDIGDFSDVPVIELFVKVGDTIKVDDAIATLESDKATMDVPSSAAGVIKEVKIALGDRVSEGKVLIVVEADGAGASPAPAAAAAPAAPAAAPVAAPAAAAHSGSADVEYDMVVLGAGPGGYSAAFRAADLGLKVVIVERSIRRSSIWTSGYWRCSSGSAGRIQKRASIGGSSTTTLPRGVSPRRPSWRSTGAVAPGRVRRCTRTSSARSRPAPFPVSTTANSTTARSRTRSTASPCEMPS